MEEKPMQEFLKEEKMREPSCNSVLKAHMVVSFWSVKSKMIVPNPLWPSTG